MLSPLNSIGSIQQYALYRPAQGAQPGSPVTPVAPVSRAPSATAARQVNLGSALWARGYHAEQAARAQLPGAAAPAGYPEASNGGASLAQQSTLPGAYPAEQAARMRTNYPEDQAAPGTEAALGAEGAQQAAEEGRCETCEERKYQDGSDDASVSYQTPTRIDPDAAAAAVRGHEMEHVYHEQAKAQREGRKVVSQTVTLHTAICPECGRSYISGGTTRTVTKGVQSAQPSEGESAEAQEDRA
jgi:hypothetical protein